MFGITCYFELACLNSKFEIIKNKKDAAFSFTNGGFPRHRLQRKETVSTCGSFNFAPWSLSRCLYTSVISIVFRCTVLTYFRLVRLFFLLTCLFLAIFMQKCCYKWIIWIVFKFWLMLLYATFLNESIGLNKTYFCQKCDLTSFLIWRTVCMWMLPFSENMLTWNKIFLHKKYWHVTSSLHHNQIGLTNWESKNL